MWLNLPFLSLVCRIEAPSVLQLCMFPSPNRAGPVPQSQCRSACVAFLPTLRACTRNFAVANAKVSCVGNGGIGGLPCSRNKHLSSKKPNRWMSMMMMNDDDDDDDEEEEEERLPFCLRTQKNDEAKAIYKWGLGRVTFSGTKKQYHDPLAFKTSSQPRWKCEIVPQSSLHQEVAPVSTPNSVQEWWLKVFSRQN